MRKLPGFKSVLKNKAAKSIMRTLERAMADGGNVVERPPLRLGSQLETETPISLPRPVPSCPEALY